MKKYMFSRDGQTMVRPPELIIVEQLRKKHIAAIKAVMLEDGQVCITIAVGEKRWEVGADRQEYIGPWLVNGEFNIDGFIDAAKIQMDNIERMNAMDEALE